MNNQFKPFILPQDKVSQQTNPNVQPVDHIGAGSFLEMKYQKDNSVQTPPEKTFSQRMTDITDQQNAEIQNSADLYKSGQQNIFSTVFQTIGASAIAASKSFALPLTIAFEKGMDVAGSAITAGREAQKQADDEAIRLGKLDPSQALSRKPKIEDQLMSLVQQGASSDTVQKIRQKYDTLSPEAKANVGALGDFAQAFLDFSGAGASVKPVAKFTLSTGEKAFDIATSKFITRKAEDLVDGTNRFVTKVGAPFQPKTQEELVGKILQGKTDDIPLGKIALENIDTKGVNTFKALNDRIQQTVPKFGQIVDEELAKDSTRYTLDQLKVAKTAEDIAKDPLLSKITNIGGGGVTGEPVKVDFVTKAMKDLIELYDKTSDPVAKQAVEGALKVASEQGLTRQEVNDLARLYGSEFSNKAFSKTGEALTSVVGQAVENTRMGLKQIAREGLGGAEAKSADAVLESFYNTQRLLQKNIEAVNKARQKFTDRTWREMIGRGLGKTIDSITGGSVKAFLGGFLPRGVGNLEATYVDLEDALNYNLKLFRRAGEANSAEESAKIIKDGFNSSNPELQAITGTAKKVGSDVKVPTTKTPTFTEGGIYTVPEKQQLYKDVIAPQIAKLGKVAPDETVVYYSGDGKAGQYINTTLDGVWGYPAENLKVMKVKTSDLVSTGDTAKDGVGYRLFAKDLTPKQVNDVKVKDIIKKTTPKKGK